MTGLKKSDEVFYEPITYNWTLTTSFTGYRLESLKKNHITTVNATLVTEPVAYGSVADGVLTLRYDKNIPTPTNDSPVYDIPWTEEDPGWDNHKGGITRVVIDPSFKEFNGLEDAEYMFNNLKDVTEISGLENFNTTNVNSMAYMFQDCKALKTIDLNSFDVSKVASMDDMFTDCTALTTIYCDKSWTDLFTEDDYEYLGDLFTSCTSLKGAVAYDENNTDITMANPTNGYFTGKQVEYITFYDKQDNTELLRQYNGQTINMKIEGRTFYKDGDWNTAVFPFDLDSDRNKNLFDTFFKGATLKSPSRATFNEANQTLTIEYDQHWPGSKFEVWAGIPFIVKWENTGQHITDPTFENVTISLDEEDLPVKTIGLTGNILDAVCTFKPVTIKDEDKTKLFMGANGKFYYPDGKNPTNINAFRFYYQLADGYEFGDKTSTAGAKSISKIVLDFGDGQTTNIITIDNDHIITGDEANWYLLDGRRLSGKPTKAGVYIVNGKKVVIK